MLDDEERHPAPVDLDDALDDGLEQGGVHARPRLVQQDDRWLGHQHAREFEQLALAARKRARGLAGEARKRHEVEPRHRLFQRFALLARHAAGAEPIRKDALAELRLPAQHDVLDQGHVREGARNLERPPEPQADPAMGRIGLRCAAVDENAAGIRTLTAREQIEHRRLPRAVGADQPCDFAGSYGKRNAVHRDEAAEPLDEALRDENGRIPLPVLTGRGQGWDTRRFTKLQSRPSLSRLEEPHPRPSAQRGGEGSTR